MLSGRGLCDKLITRPEETYRLWCVVVCDLETSRICAPYIYIYIYIYIYDIRSLRVKLSILQNSPLVQLYISARDCKGVGNIPGSHFVKVFSALLLHS